MFAWIAGLFPVIREFTPQFQFFIICLAAIISGITYVSIKQWSHFHKERYRPQWIILYACALQAIWGFSLLFFDKSDIAAWAAVKHLPNWFMCTALFISAGMSYYALTKSKSIVWLLPQQAMLMAAAMSCIAMVVMGHYADGLPYPRIFILRDQLPEILTAVFHTAAIFHRERIRLWAVYNAQLQCKTL